MGKQKRKLRNLARMVAFSTAGLSALRFVRTKGNSGALVALGKMTATATAPIMKVAGAASAGVAWFTGAPLAFAAGAASAILASKHIDALNAPNHGCEVAFSEDWPAEIPEEREALLRPYPTAPLLDNPGVTMVQDMVFATLALDENENKDHRLESQRSIRELKCDLWLPPDDDLRSGKAFIYLHGSAWHFTDKDTGTRPMFNHLASLGHVCMDVSYRLCPETDWKGMLADTQRAVAWMKTHAADYGVDPDKIVLAGGSAGGQFALLEAYTANNPDFAFVDAEVDRSVAAVVAWYPVTDMRVFYEHAGEVLGEEVKKLEQVLEDVSTHNNAIHTPSHWDSDDTIVGAMLRAPMGGLPDEVPDAYADASPVTHVGAHCPPTLILQGEHDMLVKAGSVREMAHKLKQAGVPTIYVEYPQVEHAFDVMIGKFNPATRAALYETECFLELV